VKILVELDGVLRHTDDSPISTGIILSGTLSVYNRISYLVSETETVAKHWLDSNGVVDYDNIIDTSVSLHGEDLKQRQLNVAKTKGLAEMVITSDPNLWKYAFELGIPVVLFANPEYTRPEFRPDAPKTVRAWNQVEEAIKKQQILRTQDVRQQRAEQLNYGD
jgi:hypothetical protein